MYLGTVPKALAALTGRELDDFAARHAIEDTEGLVDRLIAISTSALSAQTLANEATAREEDLLLQTIERHATGLYGAVEEGQRVICRNLYTHKDDDGAGGELVNRIDFVLSELLQRIEEFKSRERKSGRRRSPHIDWMRELYALFRSRTEGRSTAYHADGAPDEKNAYGGHFLQFAKEFCERIEVPVSDANIHKIYQRHIRDSGQNPS